MYKETIHDGSVSYSVIRSDPEPGKGAHYKEPSTLQQYSRALYLAKLAHERAHRAKLHMASTYGNSVRLKGE